MTDRSPVDAAVVTGAGRGIGREVARALGRAGLPVLCISKTQACVATARAIEEGGGAAESLVADLADYADVERRVAAWAGRHAPRRYAAVLAAAILGPTGPLGAADLAAWDETLRVNLLGNLAVVRGLLDHMLEARFGRIVFFSGGGAAYAYPLFPAYASSKAAVVRAAENLHEDLKAEGDFSVVCLAPGAVETGLLERVRSAGGEVRTPARVDETLHFVERFLSTDGRALSGRFVHVRDDWRTLLGREESSLAADHWKLRRVE